MPVRRLFGFAVVVSSAFFPVGPLLSADEPADDAVRAEERAVRDKERFYLERDFRAIETARMELEWHRVVHEAKIHNFRVAELELRAQRLRLEIDTRNKSAETEHRMRGMVDGLVRTAETYQANGNSELANEIRERLVELTQRDRQHRGEMDVANRERQLHHQARQLEKMHEQLEHVDVNLERAREKENEAEIHELEVIAEKLHDEIRRAEEELHQAEKELDEMRHEMREKSESAAAEQKAKAKRRHNKKMRGENDLRKSE